jgi:hypothetical protein
VPVKSEAQWRYMAAVAHGWKPTRQKGGAPSRSQAREFIAGGKPSGLPKRKRRRSPSLSSSQRLRVPS